MRPGKGDRAIAVARIGKLRNGDAAGDGEGSDASEVGVNWHLPVAKRSPEPGGAQKTDHYEDSAFVDPDSAADKPHKGVVDWAGDDLYHGCGCNYSGMLIGLLVTSGTFRLKARSVDTRPKSAATSK